MSARIRPAIAVVVAFALSLAFTAPVRASDGELDPSFGDGGIVTTSIGSDSGANAMAITRAGRILVAGWASNGTDRDFALARYKPDGRLDRSFGSGGVVTTAIGSFDDVATAVAIGPRGRIVVAGWAAKDLYSPELALARYKRNGRLDRSFGSGGTVMEPIDSGGCDGYEIHCPAEAQGVAIDSHGRIVVAGWVVTDLAFIPDHDFAVMRYKPDGTLDDSFGSNGAVITSFGGGGAAYAVTIDGEGRIVAAGFRSDYHDADFATIRYNSDGTLDDAFGGDGVVTDHVDVLNVALALAIDSEGRLVVAGVMGCSTACDDQGDFGLIRYAPDGTRDPSFGSHGAVTTDFGTDYDQANAVAIDARGRIVAAGGSGGAFALARYHRDGALDGSFGSSGKLRTSIGNATFGSNCGWLAVSGACGMGIDSKGRIVAAGTASSDTASEFALARYLSD